MQLHSDREQLLSEQSCKSCCSCMEMRPPRLHQAHIKLQEEHKQSHELNAPLAHRRIHVSRDVRAVR